MHWPYVVKFKFDIYVLSIEYMRIKFEQFYFSEVRITI
jgi:hypothetical protein